MTKIASAEAIGPPAGHFAVSAEYYAGAALISSHTSAVDGEAAGAAKAVGDAMSAIGDKHVDADSKPDKAPLTAAVDAFKAVCTAG